MTATTVKIGVERVDTAALGTFATAAGVNAGIGDLNGYQSALIAWVNRSGGLAGRKVVPVYFQADLSASNDTNNEARCAAWAQDNRVYAAQAAIYEGSGAVPCLAKHGVVSISTYGQDAGSVEDFQRYSPYYFAPSIMETVSLARSYVTGLHSSGFFRPADKIGLLYFTYPEYQLAIEQGLNPTLAHYGLQLSDTAAITYDGNPSSLGSVGAAVSNAELKFATEGIKDVLFLDSGGTLALFYMQNAQQQHQTFAYGFNSTNDAAFLEGQSGITSQLARTVIAGTEPVDDTNDMASAPRNPDRDRCFAILRAAGYPPDSAVNRQAMTGFCAFYFLLKASFAQARSYDPGGFAQAVASLGGSPGTAAASHGDYFGPGHNWGADRYGIARWVAACSCFKYSGTSYLF